MSSFYGRNESYDDGLMAVEKCKCGARWFDNRDGWECDDFPVFMETLPIIGGRCPVCAVKDSTYDEKVAFIRDYVFSHSYCEDENLRYARMVRAALFGQRGRCSAADVDYRAVWDSIADDETVTDWVDDEVHDRDNIVPFYEWLIG